ncbi:pyrroloquinoline quinone biosynthesis peptide chaperone PqqD [Amycolatopsis nigrescens]|uniref:pyrroloquinoline quinone biosynthesis peptide chaperone PqqD n=1 Tax=Amycolatopsis nigrescens TaxID=381445 RepID=UPI00036840F2|nr:pyrroloquinoline quinone biosynthesis peptide chaperone PqqD [Amycolatopsis nigrescens]
MTDRPSLRRGIRLTYDHVRETHVLLFPEGVLMPNPTAVAVLELCDGVATVADIAAKLSGRYSGVREQDVRDVLVKLADRKVVTWHD